MLAKILYEAKDRTGKVQAGRVDADSLEAAQAKLIAEGFTDIKFHSTPSIAATRTDIKTQSPGDQANMARFELNMRKKPGMWGFFCELLRLKWKFLLGEIVFIAFCVYAGLPLSAVFGTVILLWTLGFPLWKYRSVLDLRKMYRAYALGEWDEALRLMDRLASHAAQKISLYRDFAFRKAIIRIKTGKSSFEQETSELWPMREELERQSPGMFDTRLVSLALAAGNKDEALAAARRGCEARPEEGMYLLDRALLEARLGNLESAEQLLAQAQAKPAIEAATSFFAWTRGMLALRRNEPDAVKHLGEAVEGFIEKAMTQPISLTSLGICGGAYALALVRSGQTDQARIVLRQIGPVLKIWGDKALLTMLRAELPERSAEGSRAA